MTGRFVRFTSIYGTPVIVNTAWVSYVETAASPTPADPRCTLWLGNGSGAATGDSIDVRGTLDDIERELVGQVAP